MQLRYKSLIFLTPLIVIPLFLVGVLSYVELKNINQRKVIQESNTMLDQISLMSDDKIKVAQANVNILSANHLLKQYALLEDEETRYGLLLSPLLSIFSEIQKTIPEYYEIKFTLPDGYEDAIWIGGDIANASEVISEEPYFNKMLSSESVFTTLIHDENTNAPAIFIANPIIITDPAEEGVAVSAKLRGFLSISLDLTFLQKLVNQFTQATFGSVAITDYDNNLLVWPKEQLWMNQGLINVLASEVAQRKEQQPIDSSPYQFEFGKTRYYAHKKELPSGLMLYSIVPVSDILEQGNVIGNLVILVTIGAILLSALLIFITLQKIVIDPISKLSNAAKSIGQGELGYQIKTDSRDEIGSLAESLNTMSKNLQMSLEKIYYIANHDALTNLPNRAMFNHYFENAISVAKQNNSKLALLFFDLDDFKQINDSMGHEAGDELLQELSSRLSQGIRDQNCMPDADHSESCDLLARIGGDEFVILLNSIESPMDAVAVADRVLQSMAVPMQLQNQEIQVSCSIGVTIFPDDADTASDLKKHADIAMYHAKDEGKNTYQFFSDEMNSKMLSRLRLKARLKTALLEKQFILHYQPKVNATNNSIVGVEALIRWNCPTEGLIYPNDFIDVAEESGLITPMTEWVLNEACSQNLQWQQQGLKKLPVSVNVSSIQFRQRDLVGMVTESLTKTGLDGQYLELELTESSLLEKSDDSIDILKQLESVGVRVALDDFGTGYSSLSYLEQLPIHILKIDRSFILSITDENSSRTIIDAIIALGHSLGLSIVAEGVDSRIQLEYLRKKGCDIIQGFLFSKPLSADRLAGRLTEKNIYIKKTTDA